MGVVDDELVIFNSLSLRNVSRMADGDISELALVQSNQFAIS